MVHIQEVEKQLKRIGCNFKFWGRAEIKELSNILMPGEEITQCTNGHYEGGFAMLAATTQRLLLIDRKPMFLTIEAISYDMIAKVGFSHRLLDATIRIFTLNKALVFTTWNHRRLHTILHYTQHRVTETRQQYMAQIAQQGETQQPQTLPAAAYQMLQPAAATPLNSSTPLNYTTQMPLIPRRRQQS